MCGRGEVKKKKKKNFENSLSLIVCSLLGVPLPTDRVYDGKDASQVRVSWRFNGVKKKVH